VGFLKLFQIADQLIDVRFSNADSMDDGGEQNGIGREIFSDESLTCFAKRKRI
jgi:hypothetical protein